MLVFVYTGQPRGSSTQHEVRMLLVIVMLISLERRFSFVSLACHSAIH